MEVEVGEGKMALEERQIIENIVANHLRNKDKKVVRGPGEKRKIEFHEIYIGPSELPRRLSEDEALVHVKSYCLFDGEDYVYHLRKDKGSWEMKSREVKGIHLTEPSKLGEIESYIEYLEENSEDAEFRNEAERFVRAYKMIINSGDSEAWKKLGELEGILIETYPEDSEMRKEDYERLLKKPLEIDKEGTDELLSWAEKWTIKQKEEWERDKRAYEKEIRENPEVALERFRKHVEEARFFWPSKMWLEKLYEIKEFIDPNNSELMEKVRKLEERLNCGL